MNDLTASSLASKIEHTLLNPQATLTDIECLCREAVASHFFSVCVNPFFVSYASCFLKGSEVGICSVVGFPLGATTVNIKIAEALQAIAAGASEIDMVINIGALKSGELGIVAEDIAGVVDGAKGMKEGVIVKVILETGALTDQEKVSACTIALASGADFVKTSTGFGFGGASIEDIQLMRKVVGNKMRIKASGGIRSYQQAMTMIKAGADRLGTSSSVKILQEAVL